jgi:uncharacterized protein (TIGR00661 family)
VARILYAFSAQGRGHRSRATTIGSALREQGHEVRYVCGGWAKPELEAEGEDPIEVPVLRQILHENRVRLRASVQANWKSVLGKGETIRALAKAFAQDGADFLITDFEAFSSRAADEIDLPILSFNHQQVVTHTRYSVSLRDRADAAFTSLIINLVAPKNAQRVLISTFFFPEIKDPEATRLIDPIIRPAVMATEATVGDHVLVYHNDSAGEESLLDELGRVDAPFLVYGFGDSPRGRHAGNLEFRAPSTEGFLTDLASARAVVCTAGFTLMAEAMHLGKPLLVTPNQGIFEQRLNALFLEKDRLGLAAIGRQPRADDVRRLLSRRAEFAGRLEDRRAVGNESALAEIESFARRVRAS